MGGNGAGGGSDMDAPPPLTFQQLLGILKVSIVGQVGLDGGCFAKGRPWERRATQSCTHHVTPPPKNKTAVLLALAPAAELADESRALRLHLALRYGVRFCFLCFWGRVCLYVCTSVAVVTPSIHPSIHAAPPPTIQTTKHNPQSNKNRSKVSSVYAPIFLSLATTALAPEGTSTAGTCVGLAISGLCAAPDDRVAALSTTTTTTAMTTLTACTHTRINKQTNKPPKTNRRGSAQGRHVRGRVLPPPLRQPRPQGTAGAGACVRACVCARVLRAKQTTHPQNNPEPNPKKHKPTHKRTQVYLDVKKVAYAEICSQTFEHLLGLSLHWHLKKKIGACVRACISLVWVPPVIVRYKKPPPFQTQNTHLYVYTHTHTHTRRQAW